MTQPAPLVPQFPFSPAPTVPNKKVSPDGDFWPYDNDLNNSPREIITNDSVIKGKLDMSKYSILSVNIRSLNKNIDHLRKIVNELNPDVISLCEIFKPHAGFVGINEYHKIILKNRIGKSGGGVALMIKKSHKFVMYEKINSLKLDKIEAIAVKINLDEKDHVFVSIYRPPDAKMDETFSDLDKILNQIDKEEIVITGDVNIDISTKNKMCDKYIEKLLYHNMMQVIRAPTRITKDSQTCIDHVITNKIELEAIVTHFSPADHQVTLGLWGKKSKSHFDNENVNSKKHINKIHYEKSIENIFKTNWKKWIDENDKKDSDQTFDSFHQIIKECIQFEDKKAKVNKKRVPVMPWITKDILKQKQELEKVRKKFIKRKTEQNEKIYKQMKNNYNMTLKNAKNSYYGNRLKMASKDAKEMWKIINSILQRKVKADDITKVVFDGIEQTDKTIVANAFSDYYKHSAVKRIQEIKSNDNFREFLNENNKRVNTFSLHKIKPDEVWSLIKQIQPKCSSGFDNIPTKIMTKSAAALVSPLTLIINKIFESGKFPDKLKLSKITPVHKKNELEPQNFRPVCQQSCFSKIIEKAAHQQLRIHNIIQFEDKYQFAYKENHSCVHPIILTRHLIEIEIQRKRYVLLLMVDMSIAFETIDTSEILPEKLKFYGADKNTVDFFKSFFCKRSHFTEWKGEKSEKLKLFDYSIVQGSVLGAPIFNCYTMDLENVSDCSTIRFADDINFIISDPDPNVLIKKANEVLKNLSRYMNANKLLINKTKTSYMMIKPKVPKYVKIIEKLKLDDIEVAKVNSARYLGIIIDDKLNFKEQFNKLKEKVTDGVRALMCTRNILNYKAKMLLYHAAIKSHLDYCSIAYFDKLGIGQINELHALQKQAVRLIFRARKRSHTSKLFKLSEIIPVTRQYEIESIKFVSKYQNELTCSTQPLAIRELFTKINESRTRQNSNMIKIPNEYKKGHCMYNLIDNWNKCKNDYKMAGNHWCLKNMIKEDTLEMIEDCTTKDCTICAFDKYRDYEKYKNYQERKH